MASITYVPIPEPPPKPKMEYQLNLSEEEFHALQDYFSFYNWELASPVMGRIIRLLKESC